MIKDGIREVGVYTTKGGYVVEIIGKLDGYWQASLRTSPGTNIYGARSSELEKLEKEGWQYNSNGTISNFPEKWKNDLELVAQICDLTKLDFDNLPSNIHLVDGYPMLIKEKEQAQIDYDPYSVTSYASIFEKYKNIKNTIATEPTKQETDGKPPNPKAKFVKRMFAYWLYEPTKTMVLQVAKSIRYALVLSILGSVGYGSFHPDHVHNFILKCLPKINIQAPEILK